LFSFLQAIYFFSEVKTENKTEVAKVIKNTSESNAEVVYNSLTLINLRYQTRELYKSPQGFFIY
jgi:hypothetical protein